LLGQRQGFARSTRDPPSSVGLKNYRVQPRHCPGLLLAQKFYGVSWGCGDFRGGSTTIMTVILLFFAFVLFCCKSKFNGEETVYVEINSLTPRVPVSQIFTNFQNSIKKDI
jgi:hypothetical protein